MTNLELLQVKLNEMGVTNIRVSLQEDWMYTADEVAEEILQVIDQFEKGNFREFVDVVSCTSTPVQETRTEGDSELDIIYSNNMKMFIRD